MIYGNTAQSLCGVAIGKNERIGKGAPLLAVPLFCWLKKRIGQMPARYLAAAAAIAAVVVATATAAIIGEAATATAAEKDQDDDDDPRATSVTTTTHGRAPPFIYTPIIWRTPKSVTEVKSASHNLRILP